MSIINKRFYSDIPWMIATYWNITFVNRNELWLPKTHFDDAFVIAWWKSQKRCNSIEIKQKHRNNRSLQLNRKGYKPSIRKQRSKIAPWDLVYVNHKVFPCVWMFNYWTYVKVKSNDSFINFPMKKVLKFFNFWSFVYS